MIDRLTLPGALERASRTTTGYRHLRDDGSVREQPYRELFEAARRIAGGLQALGASPGGSVALILPESDHFLAAFFGASLGGFVPVPLYPPSPLGERETYARTLAAMLQASRVRCTITTASLLPVLSGLLGSVWSETLVALESLDGPAIAPHQVTPDDPALIQFTSGSVSQPKGVVLTHASIAANCAAIGGPHGLAFDERDTGVSWLPLVHDMGLVGMALSALYFERSTIFLPPAMFLKRPVEWLRAISRYAGTVSFAPNFAYDLCVRRVKERDFHDLDLSGWRVAGCGAEPIRAETLEAFARKFAAVGFRETSFVPSYGMAEHTLAITLSPPGRGPVVETIRTDTIAGRAVATLCEPGEPGATRIVSCGRPHRDHELRIVDDRGRALDDGAIGHVLVRGPSVMRGYFNQDDPTDTILDGGWLHTDDLGYARDGEIFICGRRDDVLTYRGRNVYPQDIEWLVTGLSGVRRAVVFPVAGTTGADPELVVMIEPSGTATIETLTPHIRRLVVEAVGLFVDHVVIAPGGTIARTPNGKLRRARMREQFEAGTLPRLVV